MLAFIGTFKRLTNNRPQRLLAAETLGATHLVWMTALVVMIVRGVSSGMPVAICTEFIAASCNSNSYSLPASVDLGFFGLGLFCAACCEPEFVLHFRRPIFFVTDRLPTLRAWQCCCYLSVFGVLPANVLASDQCHGWLRPYHGDRCWTIGHFGMPMIF